MLEDGTGVQYPIVSGVLSVIKRDFPDRINDIGFFLSLATALIQME